MLWFICLTFAQYTKHNIQKFRKQQMEKKMTAVYSIASFTQYSTLYFHSFIHYTLLNIPHLLYSIFT